MTVIGVKLCGGCNPLIDRGKLLKQLKQKLPQGYELRLDDSEPWDVGIIISGCSSACNDSDELRKKARRWILVSGARLDHIALEENQLAYNIVRKLESLKKEE
jgi:hypothetical protein